MERAPTSTHTHSHTAHPHTQLFLLVGFRNFQVFFSTIPFLICLLFDEGGNFAPPKKNKIFQNSKFFEKSETFKTKTNLPPFKYIRKFCETDKENKTIQKHNQSIC